MRAVRFWSQLAGRVSVPPWVNGVLLVLGVVGMLVLDCLGWDPAVVRGTEVYVVKLF